MIDLSGGSAPKRPNKVKSVFIHLTGARFQQRVPLNHLAAK